MVPDGIHLSAKAVRVGSDRDYGILLGNHDAELAGAAVAAKGVVRAAPELEAVTLRPVDADLRVSFLIVWDLLARRLFDPFFWEQLPAIPLSLLKIELAELRDVFRAEIETIAAERVAFGAGVPLRVFNPQRLK